MNKQSGFFLKAIEQKLESLQIDIETLESVVLDKKEKEVRDKLIWMKAKLSDINRLLNSIKK